MSILKWVIYGLQVKSFKGFSNDRFFWLVYLILLVSQLLRLLAGIVQLICWSGSLGLSFIQLLGLYFRTCPAVFFFISCHDQSYRSSLLGNLPTVFWDHELSVRVWRGWTNCSMYRSIFWKTLMKSVSIWSQWAFNWDLYKLRWLLCIFCEFWPFSFL